MRNSLPHDLQVYQENVYDGELPFHSFKKVLREMPDAPPLQLVSFHSTSKGFLGECGLRGGYFELVNFDPEVQAQLLKLVSIGLCSNTLGQIGTGLMVRPPRPGEVASAHRAFACAAQPSCPIAHTATPLALVLCTRVSTALHRALDIPHKRLLRRSRALIACRSLETCISAMPMWVLACSLLRHRHRTSPTCKRKSLFLPP